MTRTYRTISRSLGLVLTASALGAVHRPASSEPVAVTAKLSEWKVELSQAKVAEGTVTFTVTNAGRIPHALEVEGHGIERQTPLIQPGSTATLALTLQPGKYEIYCPVGEDSHKTLGMETHLQVVGASGSKSRGYGHIKDTESGVTAPSKVQAIQVTGGGPVIQILPGPFPFADSAAAILKTFGEEKEGLSRRRRASPTPATSRRSPAASTSPPGTWVPPATR